MSPRSRTIGLHVGILPTGPLDAITDVAGVAVGHRTLWKGDAVRTGVTAILPHGGNLFQEKVPAAIEVGNGFGKLAGSTQIDELGNIEAPIVLTNTLSVGTAMRAVVQYTLNQPGNEDVRSVNAVVGETNDGFLNDVRGLHVTEDDVWAAIEGADGGPVGEGAVGAGTGTVCYGFKGGIGTSSRRLPAELGGHTVGALVQTNFGGILTVNGAPVGRELGQFWLSGYVDDDTGGSCMIVVGTDAPICARNLRRLAKRALCGLARTGSVMNNGSGDYAVAFSTAYRIPHASPPESAAGIMLANDQVSPLFLAAAEATEEAIYNSLFAATTVTGRDGHTVEALPVERVLDICRQYNVLDLHNRLPGIKP